MSRKKVIVELRVSKTRTLAAASSDAMSELKNTEFKLDTSFKPIPSSPIKEMVNSLRAANETSVLVRGEIEDSKEKELESQPSVIKVWTDARIESTRNFDVPSDCTEKCIGDLNEVAKYLGADKIWIDGIRGQDIVIGVCDKGVDKNEIQAVIDGWSPWWYLPWGEILAGGDHGNMCTTDALGVCPDAKIYDIGVLKARYQAQQVISNAIAGFQWAIEKHKLDKTPHILSNSWNMYQESDAPDYATNKDHPFTRKVIEAIQEGIIVCFSAGNCGSQCPDRRCGSDYGPSKSILGANGLEEVITVGAVNLDEECMCYSSQGPAALWDKKPDFCGIAQFKGYFDGSDLYEPECDTGTSAACPIVAGVIGLLKCAFPDITQNYVKEVLQKTVKDVTNHGFNYQFGYGIIQAKDAYDYLYVPISIESPHPYPMSFNKTWIITEPEAHQIRIHFSKLETEVYYDHVYIYDKNDVEITRYDGTHNNIWTPWVDGDIIKIRLKADSSIQKFGFIVDNKETRVSRSGRYEGEMCEPTLGRSWLDLRVDIDPCYANSPVMNRISGDFYDVWSRESFKWKVYKESWVVDDPVVNWSRSQVEITGKVRYYKGIHPETQICVVIPWSLSSMGYAEVTFTDVGTSEVKNYRCSKKSNAFRDMTLEVDVCSSVNTEPIVPTYDIDSHSNRPADIPQRTLTIEEAYHETGIAMTINAARSIIDDSDIKYQTWSPAELHDAMETYFSLYSGGWPKWAVWALLAGTFDYPGVGGIMFDAAAAYGGAGKAQERQGCAIFRNHSWFNDLKSTPPVDDTEAAAMRKYLYTYVHEIGHAFNFLHSWDKGRPDALSWMNYDWKYEARNGANSFWANFRMQFDDEELIHMRHGDRASVIMGGDPWASGGHIEAPSTMFDQIGDAPIELIVRSKDYFQAMEPIILELKLKNTSNIPLELDTELKPEYGGVLLNIQLPDGRIMEYAPIFCMLATPKMVTMNPGDRYCQNVMVSFGRHGYYFDKPGLYRVRAIYQGLGDVQILSGVHEIYIGHPMSHEEDRDAKKFYDRNTGMALYLGGSDSPFLKEGMKTLQMLADSYSKSSVGAHLSLMLAQNLARPFHRLVDGKRVEVRSAKPNESLDLIDRAIKQQERDETTLQNITYHQGIRNKANLLATMGKKKEAKEELKELVEYLGGRGVKSDVLDEINVYAEKI